MKVIGVAGGSCSGKSTLVKEFKNILGRDRVGILSQDAYYLDQSESFDEDGGSVNFDHPEALEFELLFQHLRELKQGSPIDIPHYDFASHTRGVSHSQMQPFPFIFVEGTLVLNDPGLRSLFDFSYFIVCEQEVRFQRRKERDCRERGRDLAGVEKQFLSQVQPMHEQFVDPSQGFADQILTQGDLFRGVAELIDSNPVYKV